MDGSIFHPLRVCAEKPIIGVILLFEVSEKVSLFSSTVQVGLALIISK